MKISVQIFILSSSTSINRITFKFEMVSVIFHFISSKHCLNTTKYIYSTGNKKLLHDGTVNLIWSFLVGFPKRNVNFICFSYFIKGQMFSFWSHYGYVRPAGKFKDRYNSIVLNINEITWLRYCIIQSSYSDTSL